MKQKIIEYYSTLDKAVDRAVWLQFKHRITNEKFVVYQDSNNDYIVSDLKTVKEMESTPYCYPLVESYTDLSYERLNSLIKDEKMLKHWEELLGKFSVMEGELLRFIIQYQIPVDKIIRHELGTRGFDQNQQWVGFEESREIWLNDNLKNSETNI